MPTRVHLPDGSIGEFPDGMSESAIEGVLQKQFGVPSASRPAGLPAGVELPGFPTSHTVLQPSKTLLDRFEPGFDPRHPIDTAGALTRLNPVHGDPYAAVHNVGATIGANIAGAVSHPLDTIRGLVTFGKNDPITQRLEQAKQEFATDPGLALSHAAGDIATGALTDGAMKVLPKVGGMVGNAVRAPFTSGIDEPIIGTSTTPRQRYVAAKNTGVQLDLADATNAPVPKMLKAVNQDSLFGSGTYEKAKAGNIAALTDSANARLNEMSPLDAETGGKRLQDLLRSDQEGLLTKAKTGYDDLTREVGDKPVLLNATRPLARSIYNEEAPYIIDHPELSPGKPWSLIKDLADVPESASKNISPATRKLIAPISPPAFGEASVPFSEAQKLRSDAMDLYANNPDTVKTRAQGWLQRSVGALDSDMTAPLNPEQLSKFRDANEAFKDAKSTYDNPSSPLYDAIRTSSPSAKVSRLGPPTPESIRGIMGRIGDEGTGILQRGETERALGTTPAGGYNFGTFPKKLEAIPEPYADELFGNKLDNLKDISSTAQAISKDLNPSGSAKQGQKFAEMAGMFTPAAPLIAAQYPLARFLNSPAITEFMMRPPAAARTPRLRLNAPIPFPLRPLVQANGTRGN